MKVGGLYHLYRTGIADTGGCRVRLVKKVEDLIKQYSLQAVAEITPPS